MKSRWNGIYCASAAVAAGVCLSSSVAGAGTEVAREANFETEFELPAALAAAVTTAAVAAAPTPEVAPAPASAPAANAAAAAIAPDCAKSAAACDAGKTTLAAYLDRLARRAEDVDVMPECLPEKRVEAAVDAPGADNLGAVDEDDLELAAFLSELAGREIEARPASLTSAEERCCPATEAALGIATALRPMLDFIPFKWLPEPVLPGNNQQTVVAAVENAPAEVPSAPEPQPQAPVASELSESAPSDADRQEPASFFP